MSVNSKMTAIADAIRAKTGTTELLTLDAMATAISAISAGGDSTGSGSSGAESGAFSTKAANYYGYTVPVTSRKTHLVVYPKSITTSMYNDYTNRYIFLFAVDGDGFLQAALDTNNRVSCRGGKIVWYNYDEANVGKVVFGDTSIDVTLDQAKGIWLSGNYKWYAW